MLILCCIFDFLINLMCSYITVIHINRRITRNFFFEKERFRIVFHENIVGQFVEVI